MKYKKLYDELYNAGYHKSTIHTHSNKILTIIEKFHRRKKLKILDIGCASGTALRMLRGLGYKELYGIDIADKAIEYCKKQKLKNVSVSSATQLPFDDNFFNICYTSDVFEHLDVDESRRAIKEVYRTLQKGGILYCEIASSPELNRQFDSIAKTHGLKNLHITCEGFSYWKPMFENENFKIRELHGVNPSEGKARFLAKCIK